MVLNLKSSPSMAARTTLSDNSAISSSHSVVRESLFTSQSGVEPFANSLGKEPLLVHLKYNLFSVSWCLLGARAV